MSELRQIDRFAVEAADVAAGFDEKLHRWQPSLAAAEDVPPRPIDQQAIQHRLHAGELRGDLLPQGHVVPQGLRLDAADDPLGLADQLVELLRWSGR